MKEKYTQKWTDKTIVEALQEVIDNSELDRMPTFREIQNYYNNCKLTNAISKRNGIYYYAELMGVKTGDSETYFGKLQESIAAEELISRGYDVRQMPQNFPYDLLVNDSVKIDVKAARLYRGSAGNFYSYNLERLFCACDIYVLYVLNDDRSTKDVLIIPSKFISTQTQIGIGEQKSKYYKYSKRWDYIESYAGFFEDIS